jgi:hypothetical protein
VAGAEFALGFVADHGGQVRLALWRVVIHG